MPRLPLTAKGAGLVLALFSPLGYTGEWESYQDLKAHVVRSDKAAKSRPLPNWVTAREFEPRPHYGLDSIKALQEHVKSVNKSKSSVDDAPKSLTPRP